MDYVPLVENQIEDGRRLAAQLAREAFAVSAAFWVRTSEEGQWFLYLASPVVDQEGALKAYRRVHLLIRQLPKPFWIDPFDVKLVGADDPIAKEVQAMRDSHSGRSPIHFWGHRLGNVPVEEVYIYPRLDATPVQSSG